MQPSGDNGGAIDWFAGAEYGNLLNSVFTNNLANRSAGAVHWSGHYGIIDNCNFTNNTAAAKFSSTIGGFEGSGDGGAVIWVGSHGLVNNSRFINNTAVYNSSHINSGRGGAIFMHGNSTENATNTTFDGCTFINNTAGTNGGAILWAGLNGNVIYCNFINNAAVYDSSVGYGGRGGAVYLRNCAHGNTSFSHSYFKNNTAGTNGGAIDWHDGAEEGIVSYSVFEQNTTKRSGGAIGMVKWVKLIILISQAIEHLE